MGYSIHDRQGNPLPIRLLGVRDHEHCFMAPFIPTSWHVDPCNKPSERISVVHPSGHKVFYRWYEISIVGEDDEDGMRLKINYANTVDQARQAVSEANKALRSLLP